MCVHVHSTRHVNLSSEAKIGHYDHPFKIEKN